MNHNTFPPPRPCAITPPALRILLRSATHEAHERLHLHTGFAAVQNATIDMGAYRKLLLRLYGFYVPFEVAAGGHDRSDWLKEDLTALGIAHRIPFAPMCPGIPNLETAERRLGASYVVEGSALGGRELARGLDLLLGPGAENGRRFFSGRGSGTAKAWKDYLAQLSAAPTGTLAQAEIISAARETFSVFEHWLTGWRGAIDD